MTSFWLIFGLSPNLGLCDSVSEKQELSCRKHITRQLRTHYVDST